MKINFVTDILGGEEYTAEGDFLRRDLPAGSDQTGRWRSIIFEKIKQILTANPRSAQ